MKTEPKENQPLTPCCGTTFLAVVNENKSRILGFYSHTICSNCKKKYNLRLEPI